MALIKRVFQSMNEVLVYTCTCVCSAQFANLRNSEIELCKLEIVKLLTNFETEIRFRNCVALLRILETASFLKQTPPIEEIVACSARPQRSIVYSCCV